MEQNPKKKITDPDLALSKAMQFCAYQERCQQEVRTKLYDLGMWPDAVEKIIGDLIEQNFINEERFAKAYAGGKFRIKHWGKKKIELSLNQKGLSNYCIQKGLAEISNIDYTKVLNDIIVKQLKAVKESNPLKKNYKVAQYCISRGFESELVWEKIKELEE